MVVQVLVEAFKVLFPDPGSNCGSLSLSHWAPREVPGQSFYPGDVGWKLTYVVSTEMMQRLSEAGMLAEQPCSCAHSSPGWPALRGLHRRLAGWLRALGTYSAAFVDGLWFSAGLFVGSLAVQSLGCVSLRPRGLQHTRPPCPSLSPGACSN